MALSVAANRFRDELRDFLRCVRRPGLAPRLPGRRASDDAWHADWLPAVSVSRLVQWAALLWAINLVFLGPIALAAAMAGGAQHRLDLGNVPWLTALIWAPIVEELVFRYGLRRPGHLWWSLPATVAIMLSGPTWAAILGLAAVVLLFFALWQRPSRGQLPWRWARAYRHHFGVVFHFSCLAFAAVHLYNFSLNTMPVWLMPLLVLPQWLTGMVLAWLRVRRGIGASMLLHAIFNGGPLLVVWLVLRFAPQLAA